MNTEYKYTGTVYTGGAAHPLCKVSANSIKILKLSANSAAKAFGEKRTNSCTYRLRKTDKLKCKITWNRQ